LDISISFSRNIIISRKPNNFMLPIRDKQLLANYPESGEVYICGLFKIQDKCIFEHFSRLARYFLPLPRPIAGPKWRRRQKSAIQFEPGPLLSALSTGPKQAANR
jgi:hypothetical protein